MSQGTEAFLSDLDNMLTIAKKRIKQGIPVEIPSSTDENNVLLRSSPRQRQTVNRLNPNSSSSNRKRPRRISDQDASQESAVTTSSDSISDQS